MQILLVEDERALGAAIARVLKEIGAVVTIVDDGAKANAVAKAGRFDLVILDVLLPNKAGWDILRDLRAAKVNTPVLMLTAMDETGDKVRGLDLGADDYLSKPFEIPELLARVNALLRRDKVNKGSLVQVGDLVINRTDRRVARGGREIALTRREYDLLEALAVNENRVLSRETIQERVWSAEESYSNTVDVYIGTLRKKVDAPFERKLIHTVVGFGYVLKTEA